MFALVGIGQNDNLLGSALVDISNTLIFNADAPGTFSGIGFGFQKEFLPKPLAVFNTRKGKLILRFANAEHSIAVAFINDLRFKKLFYGQGTDFGSTGALQISYTQITSSNSIYKAGLAIELFTPQQDHTKTPNNPINSDDGRKNVWHTLAPFEALFYTNLYAFGTYQDEYYNINSKLGLNSEKLGAFIQNTLHDGAGLNPRFPWNVAAKDKPFYEVEASVLYQERYGN